ncbi:ABC transporter A, ABCA, partial [Kipferlia bialata]|eukprot:g5762.t1
MRALGLKEWEHYIGWWLVTLPLCLVSTALMVVSGYLLGITPDINLSLGVLISLYGLQASSYCAFAIILSALCHTLSRAVSWAVGIGILSAVLQYAFQQMFQEGGVWDPSILPRPLVWAVGVVFPPLTLVESYTTLTVLLPKDVWGESSGPFYDDSVYFTDVSDYTTTKRYCYQQQLPQRGEPIPTPCTYTVPYLGYTALVLPALQSLVLPLVAVYIAHVSPGPRSRGLPLLFPFMKRFYSAMHQRPDRSNLIQCSNVYKTFNLRKGDKVLALQGADLTLDPGVVHALCGINGAGKSTLIKVLCGEVTPNPNKASLK